MPGPDLPDTPPPLKSIQPYLKIANEHDQRDVVVSYWCRLYALQTGLKLSTKTNEETSFLLKLMDWLETTKKGNSDNEAITNDIAAQAHLENWALKLFLYADKHDRASNFGKNVVQSFYTAGLLYDVLTVFGELSEEAGQNRKYAKWKAAYIHNCLKNGETPVPGPAKNDDNTNENVDNDSADNEDNEDNENNEESDHNAQPTQPSQSTMPTYPMMPMQPTVVSPQPTPPTNMGAFGFPSVPAAENEDNENGENNYPFDNLMDAKIEDNANDDNSDTPVNLLDAADNEENIENNEKSEPHPYNPAPTPTNPGTNNMTSYDDKSTTLTGEGGVALTVEQSNKAQKYIKWAGSALNYDDVPTAITNLRKALHLLTTGEDPV